MVIPALGNVYGGPTKVVLELTESIGKLGISIDIVATDANGSTILDVPLKQWISKDHYRMQFFPYLDLLDYKFSWHMTKWLFKNVHKYDIIHTNAIFSYPVIAAHWACQFHKVPYIATPHGMMEAWSLSYKAWKKNFYFKFLERPALEKANAIQTMASTEAENINSLGLKTPSVIVPNGIYYEDFASLPNPEIFHQQFPQTRNKTLIIFLGRIDPKKGLDLLAPAFATVYHKFDNLHLILAGPDNIGFLPTAKEYFIKAGCINGVTFTGMLTGEMKYAALAAASIYVAPSYSEGFSMSILEGMATGLPCVITTGCNFPEAAMANAAMIVDIDSASIADALIQILENSQEAKEMGDRARQFILKNYTWDKVALQMISVYKTIIKTDRGG